MFFSLGRRRRPVHDPSHAPGRIPGKRAHPTLAIPPRTAHGQILQAIHLLDGRRVGVQTHRPRRGELFYWPAFTVFVRDSKIIGEIDLSRGKVRKVP